MSKSYRDLVKHANRGSKQASDELVKRKSLYKDTGLKGIDNESIIFRLSNEVESSCNYIMNEIASIDNKRAVKEHILLDSFSSATIEGARTTVDKVKRSFNNPISKDDIMVVNAIKAQNEAYELGVKPSNIRELWERLTEGVLENKGSDGVKYRSGQVYVGSFTKVVHTPEKPEKIELKMDNLFSFCFSHKDSLVKACIIHFYCVYIHPFCDGNGRFARLWMNTVLSRINSNFKGLIISKEINDRLDEYYSSIKVSEFSYRGIIDITAFIEYMLDCIASSIDYIKYKRYSNLSTLEESIYNKMKKNNSGITVKKLKKIKNLSDSRARNVLNSLVVKKYTIVDKSSKEYRYYAR